MNLPADILERVRERVSNPTTIHDQAKWLSTKPEVFPSATKEEIGAAERAMNLKLPVVLKELLLNVANGGFGPGYGLIGVGSGYADFSCGSLENVYRLAHSTGINGRFVIEEDGIVPICNWGCGIYSCVDCRTAEVSKVLLYNPKVDLLSTDNLSSVEVRDVAGNVKLQMKFDRANAKPKSKPVPLIPHRESFLDFISAWGNGVDLWAEILRLSETNVN